MKYITVHFTRNCSIFVVRNSEQKSLNITTFSQKSASGDFSTNRKIRFICTQQM